MPYEPFEVYLNDRLAGATAAVDVAQQAVERQRCTELTPLTPMRPTAAAAA